MNFRTNNQDRSYDNDVYISTSTLAPFPKWNPCKSDNQFRDAVSTLWEDKSFFFGFQIFVNKQEHCVIIFKCLY